MYMISIKHFQQFKKTKRQSKKPRLVDSVRVWTLDAIMVKQNSSNQRLKIDSLLTAQVTLCLKRSGKSKVEKTGIGKTDFRMAELAVNKSHEAIF